MPARSLPPASPRWATPTPLNGDAARARALFQKSVDTGVVEFVEHQMARRRLARLAR